jgi:hypothetical protein
MSWAFRGPSKPYTFKNWGGGDPPAYPDKPSPGLKDYRAILSDWAMRTFKDVVKKRWTIGPSRIADFYAVSPRGGRWLIEVKATKYGEFEDPTLTFATYDTANVVEYLDKNPGLNYALAVYFRKPHNGEFKVCVNCEDVLSSILSKVQKRNFSIRWGVFKTLHQVYDLNTFLAYY